MTSLQEPYDHLPIESSFSFEQLTEKEINCICHDRSYRAPCKLHEQQLQQIQELRRKIGKKDQLIKYLQRKCGNQIIKATRKLYDKINKLEAENAKLQKYIDNNKTHMNVLTRSLEHTFGECGETELLLTSIPVPTQTLLNSPRSRKAIQQQYRSQLLKLSTQQLSDIVMTQTHSLKKMEIINQKHINMGSNRKSGNKTKKDQKTDVLSNNGLRKLFGRDRQYDNQQNQNQTNVPSSICKSKSKGKNSDQTGIKQLLCKSPISLSLIKKQPVISLAIKSNATDMVTKQQQTQLYNQQCVQLEECETQTIETAEQYQLTQKQLQKLRASVDTLQKDNQALREQAIYFAEKIQDYYQEYEQNDDNNWHDCEINAELDVQARVDYSDSDIDNKYRSNSKHKNTHHNQEFDKNARLIIQSYGQILEIFGISEGNNRYRCDQSSTASYSEHEKVHQKLVQQIFNTKLQISQLLKQYRFLQKQLHGACSATNHLETYINDTEERLRQTEQHCGQLTVLVADLNDQITDLRVKQMNSRVKDIMRIQALTQIQIGARQSTQDSEVEDASKTALSDLETVHSNSYSNIHFLPSQSNISQTGAVVDTCADVVNNDVGNVTGTVECCN